MLRIHMGARGVHLRFIRMLPFAEDFSHERGYLIVMKKVPVIYSAAALVQTPHSHPDEETLSPISSEEIEVKRV